MHLGRWSGSTDGNLLTVQWFRDWIGIVRATHELPAWHSNQCLTALSGGSIGAQLEQRACNGDPNQRFRLVPTYWGKHQIRSASSGRCLAIAAPGAGGGARPAFMPCDDHSVLQRWALRHTGAAALELRSDASNMCLDVIAGSTSKSVGVQQFSCHDGPNQRFAAISAFPPGFHELASVDARGEKCLEVPLASTADGVQLHQGACAGGRNQRFAISRPDILTRERQLLIDLSRKFVVAGASAVPPPSIGFPVIQSTLPSPWQVVYTGDGFRLNFGAYCMAIPDGLTWIDGAPLVYTDCDDSARQRFYVR